MGKIGSRGLRLVTSHLAKHSPGGNIEDKRSELPGLFVVSPRSWSGTRLVDGYDDLHGRWLVLDVTALIGGHWHRLMVRSEFTRLSETVYINRWIKAVPIKFNIHSWNCSENWIVCLPVLKYPRGVVQDSSVYSFPLISYFNSILLREDKFKCNIGPNPSISNTFRAMASLMLSIGVNILGYAEEIHGLFSGCVDSPFNMVGSNTKVLQSMKWKCVVFADVQKSNAPNLQNISDNVFICKEIVDVSVILGGHQKVMFKGWNCTIVPNRSNVVGHFIFRSGGRPPESKGELLRLSPIDTIRYLNRLKESESSKLPPIYTLQLPPFELVKQALNTDGDSPAPSIAIPALDVRSPHSQMGISEKPLCRVDSLIPATKSASISSS
ncbi:hypothetical protein Tco_0215590 [Tanacetum coccineum]